LLGLLAQANRARRDTKYLLSLDDYLLKDIGISRCELKAGVVWGQARRSTQQFKTANHREEPEMFHSRRDQCQHTPREAAAPGQEWVDGGGKVRAGSVA
jgi:Domain of unknown function (DUF1127)